MIEQVFFFVTKKCNIKCNTCYAVEQLKQGREVNFQDKIEILKYFKQLGAKKLSLLGGEPTLYEKLPEVISAAKKMGYSFIRINTNGIFNSNLLFDKDFRNLDVICFSIDGSTDSVNGKIRCGSDLNTIIKNMKLAKENGFEIRVNSTITSTNIDQILDIISLAEKVGATLLYFNVMMLKGEALNNEYLEISPKKWLETYNKVVERHEEFSIKIKIPQSFSTRDNLAYHSQKGHRCIVDERKRVYISANGDVFESLVLMDNKDYRIGYFDDYLFKPVISKFSNHVPFCKYLKCPNDEFLPLCIHYKTKLNY